MLLYYSYQRSKATSPTENIDSALDRVLAGEELETFGGAAGLVENLGGDGGGEEERQG